MLSHSSALVERELSLVFLSSSDLFASLDWASLLQMNELHYYCFITSVKVSSAENSTNLCCLGPTHRKFRRLEGYFQLLPVNS